MTQEELLVQIYKKDSKAFTTLYEMYSKNLYGVIFNIIKDKEEAEDILQEVFVKIWKNLEKTSLVDIEMRLLIQCSC